MAVGINPNIQTAYSQSFGAKEGKKTGGAGKAVASAIIPGSGQLIDGRVGAGLGFLGGALGISGLRFLLNKNVIKQNEKLITRFSSNLGKKAAQGLITPKEAMKKSIGVGIKIVKKAFKSAPVLKKAAMIALPLAALGLYVTNVVDAYKGGKK